MAVTADSVTLELVAKVDGYQAAINGAATATTSGMSKIEAAASKAEAAVQGGADKMGAAVKRAANDIESGGTRAAAATRNLGRQVSDIGVGLVGGQSPFLILAQQAPQVADALADTGGAASKVASFFAGPWGAALLAAGSALGLLIPKLLEAGDSTEALVAKLQDQAVKARLAADAQAIFEKSLYGAADASAKLSKQLAEQNRSQIQVAQSALAAAQAVRQQNLQNLRTEIASAQVAEQRARTLKQQADNADPETRLYSGFTVGKAERDLTAATDRLKIARQGLANAEKAVVEASVPVLRLQAAEQADASAAATGRHERAVNKLTEAYRAAQAQAAKLGGAAGNTARAQAVAAYRTGVAGADRSLAADQDAIREANKKPPKGPSAETLARRAEAERVQGVRNNQAYETQVEQLNQQIIGARRAQAVEADTLAQIDRDQVASELKKQLAQIDADESAKKYSEQQAADLRARAQQAAAAKNAGIDLNVQQKLAQQQLAVSEADIANQRDVLQANAGLADTTGKRRDAALKLLDLAEQQERLELEAVLASSQATKAQKDIAAKRLAILGDLYGAQREGVQQQNEGPLAAYQRKVQAVGDDINGSLEGVAVNGLDKLNDGLVDAITGAKSLGDVFKDVADQIIKDLLRIAVQQLIIAPLIQALGGGFADGGYVTAPGHATGGFITGPGSSRSDSIPARLSNGEFVMNAASTKRFRPVLEAMNGGTSAINTSARATPVGGNTIVQQTFVLDARHGITTPQLLEHVNSVAKQEAAKAGVASYQQSMRDVPARISKFQRLGT